MLLATEILGDVGEERYAGRRIESLVVSASEASRPRLRMSTDEGTDVAVQLERGSFLRDGAVLHDDGRRLIVVERARERVMLVEVDPAFDQYETLRRVALVSHAFGNQHVPIELDGARICIPITTSEDVARQTVERLSLDGLRVSFEDRPLARFQPIQPTIGHHHAA
jgi:urease accessory protein